MIKTIPQKTCPECKSSNVYHTGKVLVGTTESPGPPPPPGFAIDEMMCARTIKMRESRADWIGPVHSNCYDCDHEWEDTGPQSDNMHSWRCLRVYIPGMGQQVHLELLSAKDLLRENKKHKAFARNVIDRVRSGKLFDDSDYGTFTICLYLPADRLTWEGL